MTSSKKVDLLSFVNWAIVFILDLKKKQANQGWKGGGGLRITNNLDSDLLVLS